MLRHELKTPWRNGATHVVFEPLDFMYRMNRKKWPDTIVLVIVTTPVTDPLPCFR